MKRSLLAAMIAVSLLPALPARFVDGALLASSPEDDLRELIAVWDQALKERNAQVLGRLLANNFTMTDASGAVLTKAEYLQSVVKRPALRMIKSYASDDISITIEDTDKSGKGGDEEDADEIATVTGRSEIKGRARGGAQMVPGVYRFTDRWIRKNGDWRAVSTTAVREQ